MAKVGCRTEILDAFARLEARHGRTDFRLQEIVQEVFSATDAFRESTVRTFIVSAMCENAPVHHANHTDDLRRVGVCRGFG